MTDSLSEVELRVLRVFGDVGSSVLRLPVIAEGAELSPVEARSVLDELAARTPKLVEDEDPDPEQVDDQGNPLPLTDLSSGGDRVWAITPAGWEAFEASEGDT